MATRVVYLPLDERPCNLLYPQQLAAMTDLEMIVPRMDQLGSKKQSADCEELGVWLMQQCKDADVLIVSIDMLVHGGIVPSRLHHDSAERCHDRIRVLEALKEANPLLKIYAFNLITRVPAYSSSEEEPDYYDQVGRELYELGWFTDKSDSVGLTESEEIRLKNITAAIPAEILRDYLARRDVNSQVNQMSIDLVQSGVIDYLIIPLDDNSLFGFSAMEQKTLTVRVELSGLSDKVAIYPGADEIGCTLFSRVFCEVKNYDPSLFVRYSSTKGPLCIPKYEDRSLAESIKAHVTSAGAIISDTSNEANAILMVHSPAVGQSEMAETDTAFQDRHRSYFSEINIREFVQVMKHYLKAEKLVMLADVALCNGGDHQLMRLIHAQGLLGQLSGYAAWNTSGNSLGTVISHAVIASYYRFNASEKQEAHDISSQSFYISRLIEDWGYQALVRKQICENNLPGLGASYFEISHVIDEVCELIEVELNRFAAEYLWEQGLKPMKVVDVELPWKRMFEVGFAIQMGGVHGE